MHQEAALATRVSDVLKEVGGRLDKMEQLSRERQSEVSQIGQVVKDCARESARQLGVLAARQSEVEKSGGEYARAMTELTKVVTGLRPGGSSSRTERSRSP